MRTTSLRSRLADASGPDRSMRPFWTIGARRHHLVHAPRRDRGRVLGPVAAVPLVHPLMSGLPIPPGRARRALIEAARRLVRDALDLTEDAGEREQMEAIEQALVVLRDSLELR